MKFTAWWCDRCDSAGTGEPTTVRHGRTFSNRLESDLCSSCIAELEVWLTTKVRRKDVESQR